MMMDVVFKMLPSCSGGSCRGGGLASSAKRWPGVEFGEAARKAPPRRGLSLEVVDRRMRPVGWPVLLSEDLVDEGDGLDKLRMDLGLSGAVFDPVVGIG